MSKPEVMAEWAIRHGIDRQKWRTAYASREVSQKVELPKEFTRRYDVQVDGLYHTSPRLAGSVEGMIPVPDDLVRLARQQRCQQVTISAPAPGIA